MFTLIEVLVNGHVVAEKRVDLNQPYYEFEQKVNAKKSALEAEIAGMKKDLAKLIKSKLFRFPHHIEFRVTFQSKMNYWKEQYLKQAS